MQLLFIQYIEHDSILVHAESTREDVSPSYRCRSRVRVKRLADWDSRLSPNIPTRARTPIRDVYFCACVIKLTFISRNVATSKCHITFTDKQTSMVYFQYLNLVTKEVIKQNKVFCYLKKVSTCTNLAG